MGPQRKSPPERKKKLPERELQVLALLGRHRDDAGGDAELNGRQVAREFEKEETDRIPYGTLYTILAAMEDNGWVESRKEKREGRWTRWFRITAKGAEALESGREYYRKLASFGERRAVKSRRQLPA